MIEGRPGRTVSPGGVLVNNELDKILKDLSRKIDDVSLNMEKMKIADYVKLLDNPRRLFFLNFMAGLARGLGIAVGFTILGAMVLYTLRQLIMLNLPLISEFIAEVLKMTQLKLGP